MSSRPLTLGLIQHACPPEASKTDTLTRAAELIRDAAARGATLIVTQELFTSAYFPQAENEANFALAEPIPGPTTDALSTLAKALGVTISASLFERRAAGVYHNTSVMIDPMGTITGKYRKMHIPDDPLFYEKYYFTPGDLGFVSHRVADAEVGTLVCWDQWFPEAARLTALRGAELLLYPTAIAWMAGEEQHHDAQRDAWRTVQRSHAITNGVFVAAVNRTGVEGELTFWGSSFVADPFGRVIAEAAADRNEALVVECDLSLIEQARQAWPFLRDRRIETYEGLTRRMID